MKTLLLTLILLSSTIFSQNVNKYNKKIIVFKLKSENRYVLSEKNIYSSKLKVLSKYNILRLFPDKKALSNKQLRSGFVDLSLIYNFDASEEKNISKLILELKKTKLFEYVELKPVDTLLYTPNDPSVPSQYYLTNMHIYEAWDISRGDTNVIIGITDTGTDIAHEDLSDNLYRNYNDPIDGIDNDYDGYVDNFWGWDMGNNDNNPQWNQVPENANPHGVYVSGCASAVGDNNVGIAGIGFKTKLMPVKVSANNGNIITRGYEGIVYAADHGCDIINCSWGGTVPSQFGQDVINYASINRKALVVAAAGNNGEEIYFYPASYDNVLNVTASNINDNKWHGGNYTVDVDVSAPGENVLMTAPNNSYTPGWGTSFASPMAAGAAAVVKAENDTLWGIQIAEILRLSADNIDTVPGNEQFAGRMGKGRINLYRALTDTFGPALRMKNISFETKHDTVFLSGDFVNYLKSTGNVNILLTDTSVFTEIINPGLATGTLNTFDTLNISNNPFKIVLRADAPIDYPIYFKLNYSANGYSDYQNIRLIVNKSFTNIDTNNIATSIANNGMIAHTINQEGIGFLYKNSEDLTYETGIVMGVSEDITFSNIRGSNDFTGNYKAIDTLFPEFNASQEIISRYYISTNSRLNLQVEQKVFAWDSVDYKDFIIVNYNVINPTDTIISGFSFGIFSDWDIPNYSNNKVGYYSQTKTAYTYSTDANAIYCGIQILSDTIAFPYAFDNVSGGEGGIDISDSFTMQEKYQAMNSIKTNAGANGAGNDVCSMLSVNSKTILPHDTLKIYFALMAADNLPQLISTSHRSQALYDSLWRKNVYVENIHSRKINIFPNPAKDKIYIENIPDNVYSIKISDIKGNILIDKQIEQKNTKTYMLNTAKLKDGIYFVRLISKTNIYSKKIIVR